MENNNSEIKNNTEESFNLRDLWHMFMPRWKWFLLSLIITLTIAILYILITPSQYTSNASILIKQDQKNGNSISNSLEGFDNLGLFKTNTNIQNEIITLTSIPLMEEVVKRLALNNYYYIKKGLKKLDIYNQSPIRVVFPDVQNINYTKFNIKINGDNQYTIDDCKWLDASNQKMSCEDNIKGNFGDTIQTPFGKFIVYKTKNFAEALAMDKKIIFIHQDILSTAKSLDKVLQVSLAQKEASIVNLSITNSSEAKAKDILATLIEVYNENWIQEKNRMAISTSGFITNRLGVIENELGHVDNNIANFKSEHLIPDLSEVSKLFLTESATNKKELLDLNSQLSIAKYIRSELSKENLSQPLPGNTGLMNDNIQEQLAKYNDLVLERTRLIANSSDTNPLVVDLTTSLLAMQKSVIKSINNLINALQTQIKDLHGREQKTLGQLASSPEQAKYLLSVERQQKVKEQLYLYLLQKREENELSQAFTSYNTSVITPPMGTNNPVSPKKAMILLGAIFIGLLIPAGTIFVIEILNTKVRGRKDLEVLTIPFIGEIPRVHISKEKLKESEYHLFVKQGSRNVINEAFRVVRTNLDFMIGADSNKQVIMSTSMNPGSGKTFIMMNLAMSYALKNQKTIVLDLDMRKGNVSKFINSPEVGISSLLSGHVSNWKEIVHKTVFSNNLDVLPLGTLPPNPTELLYGDKLKETIEELRKTYDYIFIDCPPVEIIADTTIIAQYADVTIFVVRAGLMEREMLPLVERMYKENKFHNLTVILNGTNTTYGRYGYRYGYGYGYGSYGNYGDYVAND